MKRSRCFHPPVCACSAAPHRTYALRDFDLREMREADGPNGLQRFIHMMREKSEDLEWLNQGLPVDLPRIPPLSEESRQRISAGAAEIKTKLSAAVGTTAVGVRRLWASAQTAAGPQTERLRALSKTVGERVKAAGANMGAAVFHAENELRPVDEETG